MAVRAGITVIDSRGAGFKLFNINRARQLKAAQLTFLVAPDLLGAPHLLHLLARAAVARRAEAPAGWQADEVVKSECGLVVGCLSLPPCRRHRPPPAQGALHRHSGTPPGLLAAHWATFSAAWTGLTVASALARAAAAASGSRTALPAKASIVMGMLGEAEEASHSSVQLELAANW